MQRNRAGALALIVGAIAFSALMAMHPTMHGHDNPMLGPLSLSAWVHGTAFAMQPVLLYGFWALTRAMGERPFAQLALCFYALAATLTMMAATMSAMIIPAIMHAAQLGHDQAAATDLHALQQTLQGQANYTVWLNRSFAAVHVCLFAVAMVLWSIAWPSRSMLEIVTRIVGLLAGVGVIAWAMSGTMTLEAQHGALMVTLVQMLWTLLAAFALMTARQTEGT